MSLLVLLRPALKLGHADELPLAARATKIIVNDCALKITFHDAIYLGVTGA